MTKTPSYKLLQEKDCVREVFERELLPAFHGREGPTALMDDAIKEELNTLFRKSAQSLVYRGYAEDPRNTDSAWVETSVFHVHYAPSPEIDRGLERERDQHAWLEVAGPARLCHLCTTRY